MSIKIDVEIIRDRLSRTCCTGRVFVKNRDTHSLLFECVSLEEEIEGTVAGKDHRIPEGIYNCLWHRASRFTPSLTKTMGYEQFPLQLYNTIVPIDRYILIHAGNTHLDTEGCILLGEAVDYRGEAILHSKSAIKGFYATLKNIHSDNIRVVIENHFM